MEFPLASFFLLSKALSFQHKPPATLWRKPWESLATVVLYRTLSWRCKARQGRKKKKTERRVELKNLSESTRVLPWVPEECFPILCCVSMHQQLHWLWYCCIHYRQREKKKQGTNLRGCCWGGWTEVMSKARKGRVRIISALAGIRGHEVNTGGVHYASLAVSSRVWTTHAAQKEWG